jgi:OmpA-OmpF porin, OOP family
MNLTKKIGILGLLLGTTLSLEAQNSDPSTPRPRHQRWELGLQAGAAQGQTDLNNFSQYENNLGGGLLLRYHVDDNFAIRANVLYADITGDDSNSDERRERGFRFSAPLTEGSLMFEADLLGKRRWEGDGKFRRMISPYGFAGVGYASSKPSTFYNESANAGIRPLIDRDKAEVRNGHLVLPVGIGVKIDVSDTWVVGFESGLRVLFNDYLDGVSQSGNSRKNDTYSLTTLSVSYRFPYVTDRDRDGVADEDDPCPDAAGPKNTNGCPDSDGDGIVDNRDSCPNDKGTNEMFGCPDGDGDGVADKNDACPDEKGPKNTGGCPDKDRDGVADKSDACPDAAGLPKFQGCPDTDGDGIKDADDRCPDQRGTADNGGCPLNDRDRDGVLDEADACPDAAGPSSTNGCPDTDGDGVADNKDKCPTQAGTAAAEGCPELAAADKKILDAAIYGVQFESGKSAIKNNSLAILDQVADVMQRYPAYNLTISGHTDSAGNDAANQRLSENRAKACYDYLVSKGIAPARMSHTGYGESRPVADNATADGKAKNRRVEFSLKVK